MDVAALFESLLDLFHTVGYAGIFGFMALESSFVPFPSEVVMGPAGILSARGEMSAVVAVIAGTAGSVAGAWFNYWLAIKLGRPFFVRYGRYLLVSEKTFTKAEHFFQRHGEIATFVCRLLPGIRQYVSLPAGLSRMHFGRFTLFTALGAGIWCTVLVIVGRGIGEVMAQENMYAYMKQEAGSILLRYALPSIAFVVVLYWLWNRFLRIPESGETVSTGRDP